MELNELGLHAACELLDTISPQFFADLVTWGMLEVEEGDGDGDRWRECETERG